MKKQIKFARLKVWNNKWTKFQQFLWKEWYVFISEISKVNKFLIALLTYFLSSLLQNMFSSIMCLSKITANVTIMTQILTMRLIIRKN